MGRAVIDALDVQVRRIRRLTAALEEAKQGLEDFNETLLQRRPCPYEDSDRIEAILDRISERED